MNFKPWLKSEGSKSLKALYRALIGLLKGVPQSSVHHPEGDVWTHTKLVRKSMDRAIQMLKNAQKEPDSPFSSLNLDLTEDEKFLLQIAALMHDVGKPVATGWTTAKGEIVPWKDVPESPEKALGGKGWQAIGHEDPKSIEAARGLLGAAWSDVAKHADPKDLEDLDFIIQHHMDLFGRKAFGFMDEAGNFKNERHIKLLLLVMLMDQLGRGAGANKSLDRMKAVSQHRRAAVAAEKKKAQEREEKTATPEAMVQWWIEDKEKPLRVFERALRGKHPHLTDEQVAKYVAMVNQQRAGR
jgi:hypothetical protein